MWKRSWADEFGKNRPKHYIEVQKMNQAKTSKFWMCTYVDGKVPHGDLRTYTSYKDAAQAAKNLADGTRSTIVVMEAVKKFVPSMNVAEIGFDEEIETDYSFEIKEPG